MSRVVNQVQSAGDTHGRTSWCSVVTGDLTRRTVSSLRRQRSGRWGWLTPKLDSVCWTLTLSLTTSFLLVVRFIYRFQHLYSFLYRVFSNKSGDRYSTGHRCCSRRVYNEIRRHTTRMNRWHLIRHLLKQESRLATYNANLC